MNHAFNAQLHKLPRCPECDAAALKPCTTIPGGAQAREPHRVREALARGEIFVITTAEARRARVLRPLRELSAAIAKPVQHRIERQIEALRREWGMSSSRNKAR